MYPPICKMDSALVTLKACEKLSLSTNNIEKMGSLTGLENLKILSVGKNLIKKLDGVADVGEHLEELWCSYNLIEKLTNFEKLTKLRVLYMSNNKVADFKQLEALKDAPLEEILLTGNPLKQPSEAERTRWKRVPRRRAQAAQVARQNRRHQRHGGGGEAAAAAEES